MINLLFSYWMNWGKYLVCLCPYTSLLIGFSLLICKSESSKSMHVHVFSHSVMSDSLWPHGLYGTLGFPVLYYLPELVPLSQWGHPTTSTSVVPFSSCPQSFPASGSFPVSRLFVSGGQSIGVSALTSVLPMNIQDWFLLGWADWISLQSKGLSRAFPNITVQKHQFFSTLPSLESNSHTHTWLLEKS